MPTQISGKETPKHIVKFYRLNKTQTVIQTNDAIYYVTVLVKGYPPRYEHIPIGIPEVDKAIAEFKKELKDQGLI